MAHASATAVGAPELALCLQWLEDLRAAGVTDWVAETPTVWSQRQERSPWVTPGPATNTVVAPRVAPAMVAVAEPAPRSRMAAVPTTTAASAPLLPYRWLPQAAAPAIVVVAAPELVEHPEQWPYAVKLFEMLKAIGLDSTQVSWLQIGGTLAQHQHADWAALQAQLVTLREATTWPPILGFGQAAACALHGQWLTGQNGQGTWATFGALGEGVVTYHPQLMGQQVYRQKAWEALQIFRSKLTLN